MANTDQRISIGNRRSGSPKNWYAGLDGIRAVAVLMVFLVHYIDSKVTSFGWVGVQIFFVLSGFLITGILIDNKNEPFRFRNFYIRRTLRIFPLFYFSWLLVLIAGFFLRAEWHPAHILWLGYLGNYVRFFVGSLARDHIYTFSENTTLEIGHFWSLAVEEQFYLIWPLVVFSVRDRKTLIRICIAVVLMLPVLRLILLNLLPANLLSMEFLYRMTFTQCDGFLLGGLIALWIRGSEKDTLLRYSNKILYGALTAVVAAYLLNGHFHLISMDPVLPWVSTYGLTLLNLSAAGLILCSLQPGSIVFKGMTLWPLRILGKYSYGFYVYHVLMGPFLEYHVWTADEPLGTMRHHLHVGLATILYFFPILAVSVCSYHLVELPFLRMKDRFMLRHRNPDSQEVNLSVDAVNFRE